MTCYNDVRDNLKSGDLIAWSHRPWGSVYDVKIQIVRMATRSEYSHVALVWRLGDRVFVIEAVEPMVRIYPLSKLGDFYWIPMDAEWRESTQDAAFSHIGTEYEQLQAIKAFFVELDAGRVPECAALVLDLLMRDGIYLGNRAVPDAVVRQAQLLGNPTYLVKGEGG